MYEIAMTESDGGAEIKTDVEAGLYCPMLR